MTDHVTHLTAKTVRHIFGWSIISSVVGSAVVAVLTIIIRSHDYLALGFAGIMALIIVGLVLVCS